MRNNSSLESETLIDKYLDEACQYMIRKDYPAALTAFQEALKIDSHFFVAYVGLGVISYDLGEYQNALDYFQKSIEQAGFSEGDRDINVWRGYAYKGLSITYEAMGNNDKAKEALNNAMQYFMEAKNPLEVFFIEDMQKKAPIP